MKRYGEHLKSSLERRYLCELIIFFYDGLIYSYQLVIEFNTFRATVVETYSEFYPEIRREVRIRLPPTEAPPTTESESTGETTDTTTVGPEPSTVEPNDSFYTQCGVRKSCFGFPGENCIDAKNCDTAVSVVKNGDKFVFELVTFSSK